MYKKHNKTEKNNQRIVQPNCVTDLTILFRLESPFRSIHQDVV